MLNQFILLYIITSVIMIFTCMKLGQIAAGLEAIIERLDKMEED